MPMTISQAADLTFALVWLSTCVVPLVLLGLFYLVFRKRTFGGWKGLLVLMSLCACAFLTFTASFRLSFVLHHALSMPYIQASLDDQCGKGAFIADWGYLTDYYNNVGHYYWGSEVRSIHCESGSGNNADDLHCTCPSSV